jgi:hypothetical protein
MGDYLDDMACAGDPEAMAEQARRDAVRSIEGLNQEMIDRICGVTIDYMARRDSTLDMGEGADVALEKIAQILGINEPVDEEATCPATGGKHVLDGRSVVGADGAPGIVDVNCSACGRSGSFALDPNMVNW